MKLLFEENVTWRLLNSQRWHLTKTEKVQVRIPLLLKFAFPAKEIRHKLSCQDNIMKSIILRNCKIHIHQILFFTNIQAFVSLSQTNNIFPFLNGIDLNDKGYGGIILKFRKSGFLWPFTTLSDWLAFNNYVSY